MEKLKKYQAWARVKGSNHQFVTTVITSTSILDAIEKFQKLGMEIQNKPYLSPNQRG